MCQQNSVMLTEEVKQKLQREGKIIGYKTLEKDEDGVYQSIWRGWKWVLGENVCDKIPEPGERALEFYGLHVYLEKRDANEDAGEGFETVVVEVECKAEDFVSAGTFSDANTAVFTKATIHSFYDCKNEEG